MQYLNSRVVSVIGVVVLVAAGWFVNSRLTAYQQSINELAAIFVASGIVVPKEDGSYEVSNLFIMTPDGQVTPVRPVTPSQ